MKRWIGLSAVLIGVACSSGTDENNGQAADPVACEQCNESVFVPGSACQMAAEACQADGECQRWLKCSQACIAGDFTSECFTACRPSEAASRARSDAVEACGCGACASECAPVCS